MTLLGLEIVRSDDYEDPSTRTSSSHDNNEDDDDDESSLSSNDSMSDSEYDFTEYYDIDRMETILEEDHSCATESSLVDDLTERRSNISPTSVSFLDLPFVLDDSFESSFAQELSDNDENDDDEDDGNLLFGYSLLIPEEGEPLTFEQARTSLAKELSAGRLQSNHHLLLSQQNTTISKRNVMLKIQFQLEKYGGERRRKRFERFRNKLERTLRHKTEPPHQKTNAANLDSTKALPTKHRKDVVSGESSRQSQWVHSTSNRKQWAKAA